MSDFVWLLAVEHASMLGNGGVSPTYIIPQGQMHGNEKALQGERAWIVLRGYEDRCMAVVTIKRVEKFKEGYYAGDFIISCDLTASFRLSTDFEEMKPYTLPDLRSQDIGIHRLEEGSVAALKKAITSTIQIKFTAPGDTALKGVKFTNLTLKGVGLAKAALSRISQNFPMDRVWASGIGVKLGPFSNFASRLLDIHGYDSSVSEVIDFLKNGDPTSIVLGEESVPETSLRDARVSLEKRVDVDFSEIDPSTVYAREFVASEGRLPDLESALRKTEAAEELHQAMLRDIAMYLKNRSLSPYESGSIDLMISLNGIMKIFELKSSTVENILAQVSKGAFQIACYVNAMQLDYEPLSAALIIHTIDDKSLERFACDALKYLGVRYLIYDPKKAWPYRVEGLLD